MFPLIVLVNVSVDSFFIFIGADGADVDDDAEWSRSAAAAAGQRQTRGPATATAGQKLARERATATTGQELERGPATATAGQELERDRATAASTAPKQGEKGSHSHRQVGLLVRFVFLFCLKAESF